MKNLMSLIILGLFFFAPLSGWAELNCNFRYERTKEGISCPSECNNPVSVYGKGFFCLNKENFALFGNCKNIDTDSLGRPNGCSDRIKETTVSDPNTPPKFGERCFKSVQDAKQNCDLNSNKDMRMAMAMANVFKNQMDMQASSNLQAACSGMGDVSKTVNLALGSYKAYCTSGYGECSQACSEDLEKVTVAYQSTDPLVEGATSSDVVAVRRLKDQCESLTENINGAAENMMKYMAVDQQMSQCGLLTAANKTLAQKCQENPNDPMCKIGSGVDCANPQQAATNLVCKCQANPRLPECLGGNGSGGVGTNQASRTDVAGADGAGNNGNFGGLGGGFGSFAPGPDAGAGKENGAGGSLNRGGGGRASVSESGGTGSAPSRGGGGGGGSNLNAKVIGSYGFGGASAGSGSGYSGGGSQGGSYGYGGGGNAGNGNQKVDLRQFLPGGQMDPKRGLAGISGPDGITGPNSDIWLKVKTRYFAETPSLLP